MVHSDKWSGTSRLWLAPGEDARESPTTAQVSSAAQGQFVVIAYTWAFEGEPQDGMIIFRSEMGEETTRAAWLDSWHMRNDMMVCEASCQGNFVSLRGSYAAPPGPDWGWRIQIETDWLNTLAIRMINITPKGEEAPAVLARYVPRGDGSLT